MWSAVIDYRSGCAQYNPAQTSHQPATLPASQISPQTAPLFLARGKPTLNLSPIMLNHASKFLLPALFAALAGTLSAQPARQPIHTPRPAAPAHRAAHTTTAAFAGNPIRPADTADPGVVHENGKWYIYHTSSGRGGHYPIVVSTDLRNWKSLGYIFSPANTPTWAKKAISWWAPEVHKVGNRYIAYFTTREDSTGRFVIGAAVADSPAGPFKDVGAPIMRNPGVGLIDVSYFEDPVSHRRFLIWKEDQNDFNPPRPTPLVLSELTPDGLHLVGKPREILRNDQPWEGVLVEAPNIVYHDDWYYLFYSGNIYTTDDYAVGVARSRSIWGPYEKDPQPILTSDQHFSGPAHQYVIQDEKGTWHIFYHARVKSLENRRRYLMHDTITWDATGWPRINNGHPGGPVNKHVMHEIQKPRAEQE